MSVVEGTLSQSVRRAVSTRVPGANTARTYLDRIISAARGLRDDLDDWDDSLIAIHRRMEARGKNTLISRSAEAYQAAIQEAFGTSPTHETQMEPSRGGPYIRFDIPIPENDLRNPDQVLDTEHIVHQKVAATDQELVGLVALNYVVA